MEWTDEDGTFPRLLFPPNSVKMGSSKEAPSISAASSLYMYSSRLGPEGGGQLLDPEELAGRQTG